MAALGGGMYAWATSMIPQMTVPQFALFTLPLLVIPLHFALVSGFWAGRYYAYPKLSPAGKSALWTLT